MSEPSPRLAALADDLVRDLAPIRRLSPPSLRALGWFAAASGLGLALLPFADLDAVRERLGVPDQGLSVLGAALTALTAAVAAFQTSVPGRSRAWALLPLPAALLWLAAGGLGCLHAWLASGPQDAHAETLYHCVIYLTAFSLPLSVLLVLMLRRACPVRPGLTSALAGLAAAGGASALVMPFHPYDPSVTDLLMHLATATAVIGLNRLAGGRLLDGTRG